MIPKPLLFIGSKRSGTSHMVRMLNRLQHIFVCPEADIIWLLFQVNSGERLKCYPEDGVNGMLRTVQHCHDLLYSERPIKSRFFDIALKHRQSFDNRGGHSLDLRWIGDKKPVQHADPALRSFIYEHFADAKCLHMIRHPTAVINSMARESNTMKWMTCWNVPATELLSKWCQHEQWVLQMKVESKLPILTVRYSDLVTQPKRTFTSIAEFLELPLPDSTLEEIIVMSAANGDLKYRDLELPYNKEALELIRMYRLSL